MPLRGHDRARGRATRAGARGVRARGRALGRRGDARRPATACAPSGDGSGARRRELPGRRARRRAPASARARRAARGPVDQAAEARPALPRSSCASSPSRTASTRTELYRKTAGNPFFVVEALAAETDGIPDTVRDAVLARAARLSSDAQNAARRRRGRAAARRGLAAGGARRPSRRASRRVPGVGHADGSSRRALRSGTSSPASPSRSRWRRTRGWSCTAERSRRLPTHRSAPRTWPGSRTTPRPQAIAKRCCDSRPRPPRARRRSARTARRRRSTRGRCASATPLPPEERAELLERRAHECYVTDEHDAAIAAIEEALECRRSSARPARGGRLRCAGSREILWCPGPTPRRRRGRPRGGRAARGAPAGRELAMAYATSREPLHGRVEDARGGRPGDAGARARRAPRRQPRSPSTR